MKFCSFFSLAALLFITGCDPNNNASGNGENKQPETPKKSPLEEEVATEAKKFLEHYYLEEGDSYFSRMAPLNPAVYNEYSDRDVTYQIKDVSYKLFDTELSEADRLNGLQWAGTIEFHAKVERVYHTPKSKDHEVGWGEWRTCGALGRFRLTKRNGIWKTSLGINHRWDKLVKPSLESIPPR